MAASVYALLRRIIRRRSGLLQLESAWLPWQIVERFMFEYAFFSTDCVLIFSGGTWHKRIWSAASGQCLRTHPDWRWQRMVERRPGCQLKHVVHLLKQDGDYLAEPD